MKIKMEDVIKLIFFVLMLKKETGLSPVSRIAFVQMLKWVYGPGRWQGMVKMRLCLSHEDDLPKCAFYLELPCETYI